MGENTMIPDPITTPFWDIIFHWYFLALGIIGCICGLAAGTAGILLWMFRDKPRTRGIDRYPY